jgi:hypothetical protein
MLQFASQYILNFLKLGSMFSPIRIATTFGAASSIDMFANFCQEIMAVLGTKSQTFSDSCAQNRHDLLAKIGEHIDGT